MTTEQEQEKRAEEIADGTRKYIIALNGGGIGLIFTLAASLIENGTPIKWALSPVVLFCIGLTLVGVSLFLAKHRALKRRDAIRDGKPLPDYSRKYFYQSYTWDFFGFACFVIGVVVGLVSLGCTI